MLRIPGKRLPQSIREILHRHRWTQSRLLPNHLLRRFGSAWLVFFLSPQLWPSSQFGPAREPPQCAAPVGSLSTVKHLPDEPIGQQHEGPVRIRRPFLGLAEKFIEHLPQPQLLEERANDEHRSPVAASRTSTSPRTGSLAEGGWSLVRQTQKEALQLRQEGGQDILTSEIGNGALGRTIARTISARIRGNDRE